LIEYTLVRSPARRGGGSHGPGADHLAGRRFIAAFFLTAASRTTERAALNGAEAEFGADDSGQFLLCI